MSGISDDSVCRLNEDNSRIFMIMSNIGFASHSASKRKVFRQLRDRKLVIDRIVFSLENDPMPYLGCYKGIDVWSNLQNATINEITLRKLEGDINKTVLDDLSVDTCESLAQYNTSTENVDVQVKITLLDGEQFILSLTSKVNTWSVVSI